jgi:hypothetical protein
METMPSKLHNNYDDSALSLSKQDALAIVQDLLDRHLLTTSGLSPLLNNTSELSPLLNNTSELSSLLNNTAAGLTPLLTAPSTPEVIKVRAEVKDAGASGRATPEETDAVTLTLTPDLCHSLSEEDEVFDSPQKATFSIK